MRDPVFLLYQIVQGNNGTLTFCLDRRGRSVIVQLEPLPPASAFTRFIPPGPSNTPDTLFKPKWSMIAIPPAIRFTRGTDPSETLISTDGSCLENDGPNPSAGVPSFSGQKTPLPRAARDNPKYPKDMHTLGFCKFRLESRGPNNEEVPLTSNRADLRAVIAALRFWLWNNEGTRRLVIATDSSYVIDGATERVKN
jgi:ribonuclease HI